MSVLKCTWDLFPSDIVRHADMEMILVKEVYLQILEMGGEQHDAQGHMGQDQDWSGGRGVRRKMVAQSLPYSFHGKKWVGGLSKV